MHPVVAALPRLADLAARPAMRRLVRAFGEAGHEIALVGGPVRDALLDRAVTDLDLTTYARPEDVAADRGAASPAREWDVGRAFGTVAARVAGRPSRSRRTGGTSTRPPPRKPEVVFGDTLDGDLRRRDFTVNAIAVRLPSLAIVDPTDGIAAIAGAPPDHPVAAAGVLRRGPAADDARGPLHRAARLRARRRAPRGDGAASSTASRSSRRSGSGTSW